MQPILLPTLSLILAKHISRQNLHSPIGTPVKTTHNFDAIKIVNPPWQDLCIEHIGTCEQFPIVSVAHYYELNSDVMKDPDMTFQVFTDRTIHPDKLLWRPLTYELSSMGIYQQAVRIRDSVRITSYPNLYQDLCGFARLWDRNLKAQHFHER